jgi:hypothetical protein
VLLGGSGGGDALAKRGTADILANLFNTFASECASQNNALSRPRTVTQKAGRRFGCELLKTERASSGCCMASFLFFIALASGSEI